VNIPNLTAMHETVRGISDAFSNATTFADSDDPVQLAAEMGKIIQAARVLPGLCQATIDEAWHASRVAKGGGQ
jgi:hypothetical protein